MLKNLALMGIMAGFCVNTASATETGNESRFRFTGELLYLRPTFDDTYYAVHSPTLDVESPGYTVKRYNCDPTYEPGFRFVAGYRPGCNKEITLAYTHLDASHSTSVLPEEFNTVSAQTGSPEFSGQFSRINFPGRSKVDFRYRRIEALYTQNVFSDCGLNIDLGIGVDAADLQFQQTSTFKNDDNPFGAGSTGSDRIKSDTKGVGPELYFSLNYPLLQNHWLCEGTLSLRAIGSASLLVSKSRTSRLDQITNDLTEEVEFVYVDVHKQKENRLIPALHSRVGLAYSYEFCCRQAEFELGYQFSSYIGALARVNFQYATPLSYTTYDNYDIQGVYLSMSLNF